MILTYLLTTAPVAVFENTYFLFFFQISKKHDFLRFLK